MAKRLKIEFKGATVNEADELSKKWRMENEGKIRDARLESLSMSKGKTVLKASYLKVEGKKAVDGDGSKVKKNCKGDCAGCPCQRNRK